MTSAWTPLRPRGPEPGPRRAAARGLDPAGRGGARALPGRRRPVARPVLARGDRLPGAARRAARDRRESRSGRCAARRRTSGRASRPWPLDELRREDALALARRGGLADPVAEALVAAVGGNALALVEAPAELSAAQRGGRAILPDPLPAGERLQRAFAARVAELPEATRDALLLAAAGAPADDGRRARSARPRTPASSGSCTSAPAASPSPTRSSARPSTTARAPSARRDAHRRIADAVPEPERSWQLALRRRRRRTRSSRRGSRSSGRKRGGAARPGPPPRCWSARSRSVPTPPTHAAARSRPLSPARHGRAAGARPRRARRGPPHRHRPARPRRRADAARDGDPPGRPPARGASRCSRPRPPRSQDADPLRASALLTQACDRADGHRADGRARRRPRRAPARWPRRAPTRSPPCSRPRCWSASASTRAAREMLDRHRARPRRLGPDRAGPRGARDRRALPALDSATTSRRADADAADRGEPGRGRGDRRWRCRSRSSPPCTSAAATWRWPPPAPRSRTRSPRPGWRRLRPRRSRWRLWRWSPATAATPRPARRRRPACCDWASDDGAALDPRLRRAGSRSAGPGTRATPSAPPCTCRAALDHTAAHGTRDPAFLFSHADLSRRWCGSTAPRRRGRCSPSWKPAPS